MEGEINMFGTPKHCPRNDKNIGTVIDAILVTILYIILYTLKVVILAKAII